MNLPRAYTPANEIEKKEITRLITLVAKSSPLQLLLLKNSLKEISVALQQLHPLQFIRVIVDDKALLEGMKKIRQNSMIWNEVIKQCALLLNQEHAFNNVLPHIPELAQSLKIDLSSLTPVFEKGDWKQCIEHLIVVVTGKEA